MARYFNANIKYLRKSEGISQDDLANSSGVDRSIISRIENNKIETSIDNAVKLANYFKLPLDILIGTDLRFEEKIELDKDHVLNNVIFNKTKDLSDEDKQKIIDIIDLLKK